MDLSELNEILKEIGLNEKESKVYLELLHLGEGFPGHIANKTGINRTTVYIILKHLAEKDLAEMKNKWGQQCFVAKSCDAFLNTQKNKFENKIKKIERARELSKATTAFIKTKPQNELTIYCKMIIENISLKTKPIAAALFIKNEETKRAEVKAITSTKVGNFTLKILNGKFYQLSTSYEKTTDYVGECLKNMQVIESESLHKFICPTISTEKAEKIIKMGTGPAIIIPLSNYGAILFTYESKKEIEKRKKEILETCKAVGELIEIYFQNKAHLKKQKEMNKKTLSAFKKILPKLTTKDKEVIKNLEGEIKSLINNQ